jgi:hypothetical protein
MPGAQHRFEFEGKEPLAIWIVALLLFANTILMLSPGVAVSVLNFTGMVHWYEANSITIQFILLGLLAVIFIAFRKRVRYIRRKD